MRRVLILSLVLMVAGCSRTVYSPSLHLSADGGTVAFFAPNLLAYDKPTAVYLLDRTTGKVTTVPLGNFRNGLTLQWIGNRLFARSTAGTGDEGQVVELLLDDDHHWTPAGTLGAGRLPPMSGPVVSGTWYQPFMGRYQGQAAVYVPSSETHIFSWPALQPLAKLDYPLRGIGDGYSLRYSWPPDVDRELTNWVGWATKPTDRYGMDRKPLMAESFELLSPAGETVMRVGRREDLRPEWVDDREAQLSPDHRTLLLAPLWHGWARAGNGTPPVYPEGFAVLEVPTGKLLYTDPRHAEGSPPNERYPGRIASVATLTNDGVYAIEEFPTRSRDRRFWLTRYDATGFHRMLELPIPPSFVFHAIPTAAAPGAAVPFMLVYSEKPRRGIVELPLSPVLSAKDLRTYLLP